ncbi:cytochrome c [Polaromonas sp. CG_9.11]|uniref:SorU family sulfite dehydrogenase c-type cytochrome subunit n=1 Tax=Polaromonas sp. CG_9.11 TaxID=2787730 RepID=UPI0018C8F1CF|nr:cytochrome c [Polaromonas sp. CG_9.11]MBG6075448.1 sulfite dehydrogenase [Polaromonas sp. CG_9.11]
MTSFTLLSRLASRPARLLLSASLLLAAALASLPTRAAEDADKMALGKKLFTAGAVPACALCHTLKDAGSEGAVGPVFDDLKPNATRVKKALYDGLGAMPSYKATLTEAQIDALSYYVSRASGAEK